MVIFFKWWNPWLRCSSPLNFPCYVCPLCRRYYPSSASASQPAANTSWWSAVQTGLPVLGQALRRAGHHHHHSYKPFVAAHWEEPDYGDSAGGGSQVGRLGTVLHWRNAALEPT